MYSVRDRPAARRQGRGDRRHRPGPARLHDPRRPRRRRDPRRAGRWRGQRRPAAPRPALPRPAERCAGPEEARPRSRRCSSWSRAPTSFSRGCARGDRAARPRARGVPGAQPEAGLRPDDRLGAGRPVGAAGRPRHELHRGRRCPPRTRPGPDRPQFPSNVVGDFGGGSTYLVIGVLAALLEARLSGEGQVVDAAIVDGAAHLNAMGPASWPAGSARSGARQHARRRRAVLRDLRDLRRQAHVGRLAGAAVLRAARREARS